MVTMTVMPMTKATTNWPRTKEFQIRTISCHSRLNSGRKGSGTFMATKRPKCGASFTM